jgi:UDP-glucuronate 4-epimerase
MALWLFTHKLQRGEVIKLHGAETARDFTFVEDIAAGVVGSLRWAANHQEARPFNLGREEPVLVRELIAKLAARLGVEARVELGSLQAGECPVTAADVSAARAAFGYAPRVSLDEGLERWVQWVRSSREAPPALRG